MLSEQQSDIILMAYQFLGGLIFFGLYLKEMIMGFFIFGLFAIFVQAAVVTTFQKEIEKENYIKVT